MRLPGALRTLAEIPTREVEIAVASAAPTTKDLLAALEDRYPVLRGTLREHGTLERRAYVRFFACEQDLSRRPLDARLPEAVARGEAPFIVMGALAGG